MFKVLLVSQFIELHSKKIICRPFLSKKFKPVSFILIMALPISHVMLDIGPTSDIKIEYQPKNVNITV